jgi:hypothetical protein
MNGFFRLTSLWFLGTIVWLNIFSIANIKDHYYISHGGVVLNDEMPAFVLSVQATLVYLRVAGALFVGMRLVNVPHKAPDAEQASIDTSYQWCTFNACFLFIVATSSSTSASYMFFTEKLVFSGLLTSQQLATALRISMVLGKTFFLVMSTVTVALNLSRSGTNTVLRNKPWHYNVVGLLDASVFALSIVTTVYTTVKMHPWLNIMRNEHANNFLSARATEYTLDIIIEFVFGVVCLTITLAAYFVPAKLNERTAVAMSATFRLLVMGLYTSCTSSWNLYEAHMLDGPSSTTPPLVIFPLAYFLVVTVVGFAYNYATVTVSDAVTNTKNTVRLFALRTFHRSGAVIMWRLGTSLCIISITLSALCAPAHWMTLDVQAGTVPKNVAHVAENIETTLVTGTKKAFSILKKIDPCRWGLDNNDVLKDDLHIKVQYGKEPVRSRAYKLSEHVFGRESLDPKNPHNTKDKQGFRCKTDASTDCQFMQELHHNVTQTRIDKRDFVQQTASFKEFDQMQEIEDFSSSSTYDLALRSCHAKECSIVLGVALAAEAAILGSDFLWFLGPAEGAVSNGAWFTQMGNRVGHTIVKYGSKLASFVKGMAERLIEMRPMFKILRRMGKLSGYVFLTPGTETIMLYAPMLFVGVFCILIGLFERQASGNVNTDLAVAATFLLPLVLVSWVGFLSFVEFPTIVETLCKGLPSALIQVTVVRSHTMMVMQYSFGLLAFGSTFLFISGVLTALEDVTARVRATRNQLIAPFKHAATRLYRKVTTTDAIVYTDASQAVTSPQLPRADKSWLQAFFISSINIALLIIGIAYSYKFMDFRYGPTDEFLNFISSLHAHATTHTSADSMHQETESGLCGLVGMAVGAAINEIQQELTVVFEAITKSMGHFIEVIGDFLGVAKLFNQIGRISLVAVEDLWGSFEVVFTMAVPVINTLLLFAGSFIKGYHDRRGTESDHAMSAILSLIKTLTYSNVMALVMITQLMTSVKSIDLYLFYIEFAAGPMFYLGVLGTALNILSVASIGLDEAYPLKKS